LEFDQVKNLVLKLRKYLHGGTRLLLARNLLDDTLKNKGTESWY